MIFIINQCLIAIEAIFFGFSKLKKKKEFFLGITFIQLFVLLAFRSYQVGVDTKTYLSLFKLSQYGVDIKQFEILNRLIMRLIREAPYAEIIYFSIYALGTILFMYMYINKLSDDVYLSVAMYSGMMYYYFSFNGMRQGLAMSIVALAISKLVENKQMMFLILIAIAMGVHSSAGVAILIWLIYKTSIKYTFKVFQIIVIISTLMPLFGKRLISFALVFFPSYQGYLNSALAEEGNYLNPIMYMMILIIFTLIWMGVKKKPEDNLYFLILGVGIVLYFASIQIGIVNRIVYYYTITVIILMPNILKRVSRIKERVPMILGAHVVCIIYSCLLVARNAHGIVPYSFFWE